MRALAIALAALTVLGAGAALLLLRPKPLAPPAPAVAAAMESTDAGLDVAVEVEEPQGPLVCARAGKQRVPNAEVLTRDFSGRAGADGCLRLPPPTPPFTVCARGPKGAACFSGGDKKGDEWMPITLELSESGKLAVEVADLRGRPIGGADVTATTEGVDWHEQASDNGVAVFARLPIGAVSVRASARRFVSSENASARVVRSDLTKVRLELQEGSSLAGKVLDPEGRPVHFTSLLVRSADGEHERHATEVDDGGFLIDPVRRGPYDLEVEAPGFARSFTQADAPDERLRIVLQPGLQLRVHVLGPDGRPASVAVELAPTLDGPRFNPRSSNTDPLGVATFDSVPAGDVRLTAGAGRRMGCSTRVTTTVRVRAPEASAEVHFDEGLEIDGVLVDGKGRPLHGFVSAVQEGAPLTRDGVSPLAGNEALDGGFELRCLRPGRYSLHAWALPAVARMPDWQLPETMLSGVAAGSQGLKITCHTLGTVSGTVTNASGTPLAHFQLDGKKIDSTSGRFTFTALPGAGKLVLRADGFAPISVPYTVPDAEALELGSIRLSKAFTIAGRVVETETHLGIGGATVSPAADAGVRFSPAETDWEGNFQLELPGEREVQVLVEDARGMHAARTARLGPGQGATIELQRGVTVAGRALDRRGTPLAQALILATEVSGRTTGAFAQAGRFVVSGLSPGAVTFHGQTVGSVPTVRLAPLTVEVPPSGLDDLVLQERTGGADVEVAVDGVALLDERSEAYLLAGTAGLPSRASQLDDVLGAFSVVFSERVRDRFLFRNVPEGAYTLLLVVRGAVTLVDAEPVTVEGNGLERFTAHPHPSAIEQDQGSPPAAE